MTARLTVLILIALSAPAQQRVSITVNSETNQGSVKPIWVYFGYDEPNYTYAPDGQKLIRELAALSPVPVFLRAHNLLTTGDGTAALKWGSTNAYTEDAAGRPVYDWSIVDRIFRTYLNAGAKPFVEIGFMPRALSIKPEPYRHDWPKTLYLGWTYPPSDYRKWAELIRQLALHAQQTYGRAEAESWYWEVWNEPDIGYWHGTAQEYDNLYDFAVDAVRSVLPRARVGGPATTGPANAKAAEYLRQFLDHCDRGTNAATGKPGAPLDFITYHAKGAPKVVDAHVQMGLAHQLNDVAEGMKIVSSFPRFRSLPIVLSESDPEGCAACSARTNPQNAYRNGVLYACYTAEAMNRIIQLADRHHANMEGMLTWAFEFEAQPYFDGFRTLATNGIDKPVLNLFRMAGLMDGNRVAVASSGAVPLDTVLHSGVRGSAADIDALATRSTHSISVMIWNYHDDDIPGPDGEVSLKIRGLPAEVHRFELRHYRIDATHSNAYTVWKQAGSPQQPTPDQVQMLEAAGQLQMLDSPHWTSASAGEVTSDFTLPRQAVSLVQVTW